MRGSSVRSERLAHNQEVEGSNPSSAPTFLMDVLKVIFSSKAIRQAQKDYDDAAELRETERLYGAEGILPFLPVGTDHAP